MSRDPAADIRDAERRATVARERLTDDLHTLQLRLKPKTLAREAARSVADAGQNAANSGLDFAIANPAPVAGAVAVTGLFLLRKRIARLFRRTPKPAPVKPSRHHHSDRGKSA